MGRNSSSSNELTEETLIAAFEYFEKLSTNPMKLTRDPVIVPPWLYDRLKQEAKGANTTIEAIVWKYMFQNDFKMRI